MWIKMKKFDGTEQVSDVPFPEAERLIANDIAVRVPPPQQPPAPEQASTFRTLTVKPYPPEVTHLVRAIALANQPDSYKFIQRFIDLEARVKQLETLVLSRTELEALLKQQPVAAAARGAELPDTREDFA